MDGKLADSSTQVLAKQQNERSAKPLSGLNTASKLREGPV